MNMFFKKTKYRIVMMVILAMLLQIIGPVVQSVYAAMDDNAFRVVDERLDFENEKAYIDWAFTLDPDDKVEEYSYIGDFNLEEPAEERDLIVNDEDKTVIGTYSISTEGEITVNIDPGLYKEEDVTPVVPGDIEDEGETGEPTKTPDPVEPEGNEGDLHGTEGENGDGQEASMLGKVLTNLVYSEDDLPLVDFDIGENKVKTFKGTIEVEGAREKEKFNLFGKLVGLFSTENGLGDIFTDVKLIINGEIVANENNTIVNLDELDESISIGLEFDWELRDNGEGGFKLEKGDWAEIQLPAIFKGVTGYMNGLLLDGSRIVGTYEINDSGVLKVVFGNHDNFDEDFLTEISRKGTVGFILDFVLDPFNDNSIQEIEFGAPINKTFIIKVKPSGVLASISKSGGPNKNTNADAIDWVIDVNTSLESLTDAIIKDIIPEGLKLEGTIEVYNLKVGMNGNLTQGDLKKTITPADERNLEVTLGQIDTAYRIKYTTKITDFSKSEYTNKAELYDGDEKKAESTVIVGKVEQGAAISKRSLTPDKNATSIKWEIDVNKGQESLENVIVEDVLQENLTVKEGSIKIFKLNMVDGSWVKGDEVSSFNTANFSLSLGNLGATDVYRIEFETDIEYMDYEETNTFINKAILKADKEIDGETKSVVVGESTASATVYRDPIIIKEGKEITSYDSEYPLVEWTIKINGANHHIYGAVLTDTIGSGLELIDSTIAITDSVGDNVPLKVAEGEYPRILDKTANKMEIGFGDINLSYTIKYHTKIISIDEGTFINKAELRGTGKHGVGVGEGESPIEYDVEKNVTVPPSTVNNSYSKEAVSIDYSNKTMTWQIEIDAVKEELTALTITDTFYGKYMVFIKEGFNVTKGGTTLVKDTDYTLTNNNVTGFVLVFQEAALGKEKYVITYKTSFDPNMIISNSGVPKTDGDNIYRNKVNLTGTLKESVGEGTKNLTKDLVAAHNLSQDIYNVGKKEGKLDREKKEITWRIYVNAQSRDLKGTDFKVTDTIAEGHTFKADSLSVKEFTLKPGGNLSVEDAENGITLGDTVNPTAYTLDTMSNPFTLTFSDGINKAYLIEYTTEIKGITQSNYTNSAKINDKSGQRTYPANVYYKDHNVFITKEALNASGGRVFADDVLNWKVVVNESLSEINNAEFTDTISAGHVYVIGSLKVYKGSIVEDNLLTPYTTANADANKYKLDVTSNTDGTTSIKVELGNIKGRYIITYDTAVISSTGVITNTATLKGTEFSDQSTGIKKFNITKTSWGTGTGLSELRGAIKIKKVDNASTPNPVVGAEFELYYKVNSTDTNWYKVNEEFYTGADGTLTIGNLPKGRTYKLVEAKAPTGYRRSTVEADYTREITVVANTTTEAATPIVNERIRDITVKKVWIGPEKDGAKAIKDDMTVKFTLEGKVDEANIDFNSIAPIELNGTPKWEGKFSGLDYYDSNGKEINYSVEEQIIYPTVYDKTPVYELLTGSPVKSALDVYGNFILTFNNKNVEKIKIPVEKVWRKDATTALPTSVNIKLNQDNSKTLTLSEANGWKDEFIDLIKYDDNGNEIEYTVKEDPKVQGFSTSTTRKDNNDLTKGYTVTNIELMDIPVTKNWIGTPKTDTVKFTLHEKNADGTLKNSVIQTLAINGSINKTEHATWTGKFENVPKYKADSNTPIQYGIKEVVPTGFRQHGEILGDQSNGFTVTNMELVDVKVTKKWIGAMVAGDTINIQLYKQVGSGEKEPVTDKMVQITNVNNQIYTYKNLDKYEIGSGNTKDIIDYSVDEDLTSYTDKYEKEIAGSGLNYTITNKNIQKISIPVEKVWRVEEDSKKETVTIKLLADGTEKESMTLNTPTWAHTFTELFKYNQTTGNQIVYTVEEVSLPGFNTVITGNQNDGFKITNIELMDIPVTKNWIGNPKDNVEVTLYEDNGGTLTKIGNSKTLSSNVSWEGKFTGIPKYKANGTPITYTVKETAVSGYKTTYSGDQVTGFTITNRELINIKGTKVWENGPIPKPSVKLQLYKDGAAEGAPIELNGTETSPWTHTWVGLNKTDELGKAYTYTVDEADVPNYNKAITGDVVNGFIITNTYESPKKDVTATKEWIGGALLRPDIWFKLYRKISTDPDYSVVLEAEIKKLTSGVTEVTWTAQAENDINGNPYTYSVKEVDSSGDPSWKPDNYIKTENLLTVTNSYNSPMDVSLKAIKVWDGGPSPKPTIWFKLYRTTDINVAPEPVPTSEVADAIKELADGTTQVSWTGLTKTDVDGIPYIYSVKEVNSLGVEFVPENYKVSYSHNDTKTEQTVTNTYESLNIQISIEKIWEDGPKPEVEIELYRNSDYQESKKLNGTETTPWTHTWELNKTDKHGNDYVYTIKEVPVANYTTAIGSILNKFTITNTYVVPQIEITGTKVWLGGSSTRPIIELQLYRDGIKHGDPVELDGKEDTPWSYIWKGLDKTDIDGKEYKYTVDEVNIPSYYYKSISNDGLTITNTYSPPEEPYYPDLDPKPPVNPPTEPEKPTDPVETTDTVDPTDPVDPTESTNPEEPPTVKEETPKDTPKEGEVEVPENSPKPPKVNNPPENGTVTVDENGKWTYAPNPGFEGKDKFSIIITHPDGTEEEIFFEIDVETPLGGVEVGKQEKETTTLPKTGEINSILLYLGGLFLILLGVFIRRKIA